MFNNCPLDISTLLKEKSGNFKLELLSESGGLGRKISDFLSFSRTRSVCADYRNK